VATAGDAAGLEEDMGTMSLVAVVAMAGTLLQAPAGKVAGTFKSAKKGVIQPTAASAFSVRMPGEPLKRALAIVLAEGAMNPAAAVGALDPHTALINQDGMRRRNYITLIVTDDGAVRMNATFAEGNEQIIDSTRIGDADGGLLAQSLVAEFTVRTADRLAGRVRSARPATTMSGDTYQLDVDFDVAVTKGPAGKALGAGGGEPGKVVNAMFEALRAKDWKGLQACVKKATLDEHARADASSEENFAAVAEWVTLLLPKGKTRVVGAEERGDEAIVEVAGEMMAGAGDEALYLLRMVRESGGWRFDRSSIAGFL
jgi:hypothetical protein